MYHLCLKLTLGRCNRVFFRLPMRRCMAWDSIRKAFSIFAEFQFARIRQTQTFRFHFFCRVRDTAFCGTTADLTLYEDEGDNYDYEHGTYSLIPIHWNDKAGVLTIGDRRGSFPGMLTHRRFRIVIVREGRGTGMASSSEPDATIQYEGKKTSVHFGPRL
jgi:hypothetical protein